MVIFIHAFRDKAIQNVLFRVQLVPWWSDWFSSLSSLARATHAHTGHVRSRGATMLCLVSFNTARAIVDIDCWLDVQQVRT